MSDKVEKFLKKLDARRLAVVQNILAHIESGDFVGMDMKKLTGEQNRFRIRKGDIRIKFSLDENKKGIKIEIQWRTDTTYRP
ncbi:MAG: hypothetical protein AAB682_00150 [Patescibacteria group bacterium]